MIYTLQNDLFSIIVASIVVGKQLGPRARQNNLTVKADEVSCYIVLNISSNCVQEGCVISLIASVLLISNVRF